MLKALVIQTVGNSSRSCLLSSKSHASTPLELTVKTSSLSYILGPSSLGPGIRCSGLQDRTGNVHLHL